MTPFFSAYYPFYYPFDSGATLSINGVVPRLQQRDLRIVVRTIIL